MPNDELDVLLQAESWLLSGQKVVLLVVTKTVGSAPRPTGSFMVVSAEGRWAGSISGGCVEQAIFERLHKQFPSTPEIVRYGEHGKWMSQRLMPCGGTLELLIEPLAAGSLQPVLEALQQGKLIARHLDLQTAQVSFHPVADRQVVRRQGETLIRVFGAQWRLILIGATHIARYIAEMAPGLNFATVVCEPRVEHVANWLVPDIEIDTRMPDEVVVARVTDAQCAVVALTHDPRLDDLAILEALPSAAFYVGVLGSTRTNAKRRARLAELGIAGSQLARLHGPVGLDIGSRTPAEIALSILSELVLARRNWRDSMHRQENKQE